MSNIVFHNPHVIWLKDTVPSYFSRTRSVGKYDYLFDYVYKHNKRLTVLINNAGSEPVFKGFMRFLNKPVVEFYAWLLLNRLNPFKFKIIGSAGSLTANDCLFSFIYGNFTYVTPNFSVPREPFVEDLKNSKALKIVHLSHYGYCASVGSLNTRRSGIDLFIGENNLRRNNSFFRHYYDWYQGDVYTLPYVPQRRFVSKTKFAQRITKALATGTNTHKMTDGDFTSFFNDNRLQPLRAEISENSIKLEAYIDSLITNIVADKVKHNVDQRTRNVVVSYFIKLFKYCTIDLYILFRIIWRAIRGKKQRLVGNQKKYYNIDIVEKYNQYQMFVVPEEVIGLPGIGFVEGMACGCAYIGLRDPMYSDIGLIDGVHYVAYDGSLNGLVDKISYYQKNPELLEEIALNGYNYVKENFNENKVVKDLLKYLESKMK